jgi:solute carrier family 26, other
VKRKEEYFYFLQAREIPNIKIFHYAGCLNFSGRLNFKTSLLRLLNINLAKETRRLNKSLDKYDAEKYLGPGFKCLILDFSALSYIDPSGVYALKVLVKEFTRVLVPIYISGSSCKSI